MVTPLVEAMVLSVLPIAELRGGIPWAILHNVHPGVAFLACVLANFLVIPFGYLFLTHINKLFFRFKPYERFFNRRVEGSRHKLEKYVGTKWEFIALMLLVAIPLPFTGAYTGTLLAWFFDLGKKRTYAALGLGIIISGTIVTLLTLAGRTIL